MTTTPATYTVVLATKPLFQAAPKILAEKLPEADAMAMKDRLNSERRAQGKRGVVMAIKD